MSSPYPDEKRSSKEAALVRADCFCQVLFAGLADDGSSLLPEYRHSLPRSSLPVATALVEALCEAGIETPEALAYFLANQRAKAAPQYAQGLWNVLSATMVHRTSQPDWDAVFGRIGTGLRNDFLFESVAELESETSPAPEEATGTEDDNSDETGDDILAQEVSAWAKGRKGEFSCFGLILEDASRRPGINPDLQEAVRGMARMLNTMKAGEMPSETWRLELTLSQGMEDSHGTRTYSLTISEDSVGASCHGTEWQRGVGSDSWQGAEFRYGLGEGSERNGDFYSFVNEFNDAINNADYVMSVSLNDDGYAALPEHSDTESEGERLEKQLLRQVVGDLQEMEDTLFGDNSVLTNVWDEICVQQQLQESVAWDTYEVVIRSLIEGTIEVLPHAEMVSLWLLTEPGIDWIAENENDDKSEPTLPSPCNDDSVNHLFARLMSVASDYTNHKISAYLNRQVE